MVEIVPNVLLVEVFKKLDLVTKMVHIPLVNKRFSELFFKSKVVVEDNIYVSAKGEKSIRKVILQKLDRYGTYRNGSDSKSVWSGLYNDTNNVNTYIDTIYRNKRSKKGKWIIFGKTNALQYYFGIVYLQFGKFNFAQNITSVNGRDNKLIESKDLDTLVRNMRGESIKILKNIYNLPKFSI